MADQDEPRLLNEEMIQRYMRILHGDASRGTAQEDLDNPLSLELRDVLGRWLEDYEDIIRLLNDIAENPYKDDGEDWMNDESDVALARFRFWWTWGN
jgi:hypothetical protein